MSHPRSRLLGECFRSMRELRQKLLAKDAPSSEQFNSWLSAEPVPNIFELLLASVNIMETSITESRLKIDKPDLTIRPPLGEIRFLEFGRAEEIISIGYDCAREQLKIAEMRWASMPPLVSSD
jgi:NTE family protein